MPVPARLLVAPLVAVSVAASACGTDEAPAQRTIVEFPDARPGDLIALRASDTGVDTVEWIDRRAGTIRAVSIDGGEITTLAEIDVSTEGEQRGLLGHTVIDGVRYAAWTDVDTEHLVVGALSPLDGEAATVERIVWDGGGTAGGAVGGHLERGADGTIVLGIGQRTDWARTHGSGALVALDPNGPADQLPVVLSDGYTNPFAFVVDESSGALWVADNAVGEDVETIGRGDLADRDDHARSDADPRAPSAVVALENGDLAICGFLDAELRPWSPQRATYGDALGPCLTGVAVLPDGTVVTATDTALVAR